MPQRKQPNKPQMRQTSQADQLFAQGLASHQQGQLAQAQAMYEKILKIQPRHFDALHLSGVIAYQAKKYSLAVNLIRQAIEINPNIAEAYSNRGLALQELKQFDVAVASYDKAIALKPDLADAYYNRGNALEELMQFDAAVASYDKAIALNSDYAEAYSNRGLVLQELKQFDAALASCDKAIALNPYYAEAYSNRGNVLQELKQFDAAVASCDKAIALNPYYAEAYSNRGNVLQELKQFDAAVASYDKAIALKPDYEFLLGTLLHTRYNMCDWTGLNANNQQLVISLENKEKVSPSFPILAIFDSSHLQRLAAEVWVETKHPSQDRLGLITKKAKSGNVKIRIGYYSADFHNHATSYLMAELFEVHEVSKFELYGFSFGPNKSDEMRLRVSKEFDHFFDVTNQSDHEVAKLSRELGIDIAVDLKGFTQDSRAGIFAHRCAPIQVNYLGYPGTMGAPYIDYIIADKTIIPEDSQIHYTEKVVYLPHSYQVNDSKRKISERVFTKSELGLPESGFVFCCFNNNYKITPATFDGWMRILKAVEGSVLWLFENNPTAAKNLRQEAHARGIDSARLIFAQRMPVDEHLARHRLADLFIDTLPYNAHTTTSDALWAGLPVLTLIGKSFAARVAASLLNAIEMPELITHSQEQYESKAIELATNPKLLGEIKLKLARNRLTTPLFNTPLFTKHIEAAYVAMYERYQADLPPEHIYI